MKKEIRISDLCSSLEEKHYQDMEIASEDLEHQQILEQDVHDRSAPERAPSAQRVQELVFSRLHQQSEEPNTGRKGIKMKKKTGKVILVAAILCICTATVFAVSGGLDYFKSIFGDSANNVEENIWSPMISAENDTYKMTLESMLSDGYKTNFIISLENKKGEKMKAYEEREASSLFGVDMSLDDTTSGSVSNEELPEFSAKTKKYYLLKLETLNNIEDVPLSILLNETIAPLQVDVTVGGDLGAKEISINPADFAGENYKVESVQLSPLGVMVIGSEEEAKGGLPTAQIDLVMKDGKTDELISERSFDRSDDGATVQGGGSAVISGPGEEAPLVTGTHANRNPDGKVITSATFSRILNLNDVKSILVNGVEYTVE